MPAGLKRPGVLVVGLTGGLGSGKTTVARMFARLGAVVIDADRIVHEVLDRAGAVRSEVIRVFGEGIATGGRIDRRKLAAVVFRDARRLRRLEAILHPVVIRKMRRRIRAAAREGRGVIVLDVPLLFEAGLAGEVDRVVVVTARREQRIRRAAAALRLSRNETERRMRAQMPLRLKVRAADAVIDNSGEVSVTRRQVTALWRQWRAARRTGAGKSSGGRRS